MRAIKFTDASGNVNYVEGDAFINNSLLKVSIANKVYKGQISTMFFKNYSELQEWLSQNPYKMSIGKGCLSTGLKNGNSNNNLIYKITKL